MIGRVALLLPGRVVLCPLWCRRWGAVEAAEEVPKVFDVGRLRFCGAGRHAARACAKVAESSRKASRVPGPHFGERARVTGVCFVDSAAAEFVDELVQLFDLGEEGVALVAVT